MKTLKSLFIALALIMGVGSAYADEGQHGAGFNFGYSVGSGDLNNFGIGVRYNYQISDNFRIEPSFMYYFDTKKFAMKEINMNAHYMFNTSNDKVHPFPVFGVTTVFGAQREYEGHEKDTFFRFGVNLGGGIQFDVTDDFALVCEAKYRLVKTFGSFGLTVGCVVTF